MRQNQFGFTLGGPIVREKWHFFGSYQGTRQRNGLSSVSLKSVFFPPGFNEQAMPVRDPAALGALFGGQSGFFGGAVIATDGSNINPISLAILNARLADGSLLIPDPQVILPNGQGFSTYSVPARWTEDQFMVNLDYIHSQKSKVAGRFFFVDNPRFDPLVQGNVPGGARQTDQGFRNFSLKHTYVFSPSIYHEARLGVHRTTDYSNGISPLDPASVGLSVPNPDLPHFPTMSITGSWSIGTPTTSNNRQTTINVGDSISYVRRSHIVRAGFDLSRVRDNFDLKQLRHGTITFLSWPDFLLGLNATQNGSAFSNLSSAQYLTGITDRALRVTDWAAFAQDDWKVHQRLTLNLGLRLERIAFPSELHGKLVNLWPDFGLPDPPPTGTLSGFVAPRSYLRHFGQLPGDATLSGNNCALLDCAHNSWGPRFGLAWQPLSRTSRLVLRTGYGIFYTRLHGNNQLQLITNMPFVGHFRLFGADAADRSLDDPWAPSPPSTAYPIWHFRVPGDAIDLENISPDFEPSIVQQWGLNLQVEFLPTYMLEVGYVGAKGDHIFGFRQPSMPLLASPSNPIRGETTNTIQNIRSRVPWLGYGPTGILEVHSSGRYWHNGLEASVTKRFVGGLQFLVSYTFSKTLDDTHRALNSATFGGYVSNDQRNIRQARGTSDFSRRHRLVASYLYELPGPSSRTGLVGTLLNGWLVSGVITLQSGMNLTVTDSRSGNIFGWPRFDTGRAELAPGATHADVNAPGPVHKKLDGYFNASAFVNPPVIGNGFDFGSSPRGIARGPDQRNFDVAIAKKTPIAWITGESNIEFRAEFFNAFNTPQFANPVDNRASSSFGQVSSTIVGPRVIQFALKFNF